MKSWMVVSAMAMAVSVPALAGERTEAIQVQLDAVGYAPGPTDGIYGKRTRSAVGNFQAAAGLPVTGWFDPATRRALQEAVLLRTGAAPESGSEAEPVVRDDADGDEKVDEMLGAAQVDTARVRLAAVEVLGELKTTRARAALGIVLYGNALPAVRIAAARELGALGAQGDTRSVQALAFALDSESDAGVRDAIASEIERNLPFTPVAETPVLTGAWEGELVDLDPEPEPEGLWRLASIDAPSLPSATGTLHASEATWTYIPSRPEKLAVEGVLESTADARFVRGKARTGTYLVVADGERVSLDEHGWFRHRLRSPDAPVTVREYDVDGRVTERLFRLAPPAPAVARR